MAQQPRPERERDAASAEQAGTWGERDAGLPDERAAMREFAELQRELSELSRAKSRPRSRAASRVTTTRSAHRAASHATTHDGESQADNAGVADEKGEDDDDEFELDAFIREGHFEKRKEGRSAKKVGVVFKNLTVEGAGETVQFVKTLPDAILATFGPDLYRLLSRFLPFLRFDNGKRRTLIHDFTGVVRGGEMMLVLGRPGSGCSTFLKAIANDREAYASVKGDVTYGGIPADKQKTMYRGEVNYNPEDDVHFANMNVWQTLVFALMTKTRKGAAQDIPIIAQALMKMFGIPHTKYTLVGDEYTRGVSGGERKRVSIAETLASKATVVCWDNSTRGLDASTALDYAKSLRIMTDISDRTLLVSLYQVGQNIFELMDKVMVIDAGRCIYQGPANEARQYFIDLGFEAPERQTTADFLTAVTDPKERRFREGCEASTPKTPEELEQAYRQSPLYTRVQGDIQAYETHLRDTEHSDAKEFESAVREGKSKTVRKKSPYTVSFVRQVQACVKREFWLLLGDKTSLYTKASTIICNALIVGSLFYGEPLDTDGVFTRGGALFFSVLFLGWLQLSELMKAVSGRAVVARHREYAFYRPSAVSVARVVMDIPVIFVQVCVFCLIMYFMSSLDVVVSKFWIYLLFVYTMTMCMTALYRMFAALSPTIDDAVRFSGIALNLLIIYTGYVIPKTQLVSDYIWFGWIYYINPISYAFEAVLTNEFSDRNMACADDMLVPQGTGVDPSYQGCVVPGAAVNAHSVNGAAYLDAQYSYTRSHLWRNFGVLIAWAALYILVTVFAVETFNFARSGGGALIFKKTRKAKRTVAVASSPVDEEKAVPSSGSSSGVIATNSPGEAAKEEADGLERISKSESIFTWQDVEYTVPYQGGQRKLLNKVSGYVKPGVMIALMGASGAGKTTLLNTLAQRQRVGVVSGEMKVDGQELGLEFQRGTGFCEQMDLHDGTATIREALEFSALLRQDREVPRAEKLAYVDTIIDLLELRELQDAIISSLGVEQRKRLTIGVELAAKPQLLLFLDEPTSGLDSQSAWSIISFLKKLSRAGQAIVCTIHQPSSEIIQTFDMILALNPGGNTFYFGPVGENGSAVIEYFAERGVQCPPNKNVAEFILETAAKKPRGKDGKRVDWNEEWRTSPQAQEVQEQIEGLKLTRSRSTTAHQKKQNETEYAATTWMQTYELTKRIFRQYWRDPSYLYGKLFVSVIIGIFNGFTFWQLGNSTQAMQDRMFTVFLIVMFPPTIVNGILPKFFSNMALWQAREFPSRIYGFVAFTTAQILGEIPMAIIGAFVYWVLWYFATGLPTDSSTAGYVFLMTLLFFIFMNSWGQWICAFAPSFTVIANVLPFFFVMFSLMNGVVRPFAQLPVFWRYWMYYLNPSTYWIGGVLSATLTGIPVECTADETGHFDPPPGQTCGTYAGSFAAGAGGYLVNPTATADCQYCPYSLGDQYLATLNITPHDKWPYFGIFLAFCISNWALVYFFIYTVRIRGWSFGFGLLFGSLGKVVDKVKSLGKRKD
ncbi:putative ABC transporter [Cryphonectria parasitica EP155]|uniref:ABC transporter n=1 Tax=Cryphonectria parasitica (strain ATCC 38755 / EP155) TaxID=660469 RepID=A0A9P4YB00_CRYP1|nr:putative ABC transporter [Cryphonectria parasitica EP155]KAF3769587.1 putative ABC transporter [Cryphonectria parasitica EP155]